MDFPFSIDSGVDAGAGADSGAGAGGVISWLGGAT